MARTSFDDEAAFDAGVAAERERNAYSSEERRKDIAWAVATERERCAKIAEKIAAETPDGEGEIYIASKIAKAIRSNA